MRNLRTFISKGRATLVAAAIAFGAVCSTSPVPVNAATYGSDAAYRAAQAAQEDFGGYLDRANDSVDLGKAKTAKQVFESASEDADISGDDWKFGVTVGDYFMDFMSGEVTTGGYATGATVDVFVNGESLFTVSRDGSTIDFGFDNYFDLSEARATTAPFILTGQVSWGVEMVASADMAMAFAIYDFLVEEDASQSDSDTSPQSESIDALYDYVVDGGIDSAFRNARNEAANGVQNGWTEFSDTTSLLPNSNGLSRWNSGVWEVSVYGQVLKSTGLEQGFVTVTDTNTGSLLRFSFTENGSIKIEKKKGGTYVKTFTSTTIEAPSRYSVIAFVGNGEMIDTELLALAAVVDNFCSSAPRG